MSTNGMPGPGGSLGRCAVCGENFLLEILLNKVVKEIEVNGCDQRLFAHEKCVREFEGKQLIELPEKSPLRIAAEKANADDPNQ